jgi:hypothetical protein
MVMTFDPPIAAFGAYMTDLGDFNGQVRVQLLTTASSGTTETVLSMNCDTAIADQSSYARTLTAVGNAQITAGAAHTGAGGLALDGTGDYVTMAYATELNFRDRSFTLTGKGRLDTSAAGGRTLIDFRGSGSGSSSWELYCTPDTRRIAVWTGTATILQSATNSLPVSGTWFDWRVTRDDDSGVTKIFIDGTQVSSATFNPLATSSTGIRIGANQAGSQSWLGALDEISFSHEKFDDSGADEWRYAVTLHLDADSNFDDSSTFGHTVTANGNAQIAAGSARYGGGGILFDGTGDYLSIPYADSLSFDDKKYTIEGHARMHASATGNRTLVDFRGSGSGSSSWELFTRAGTRRIAIWTGSATILESATNALPALGTWFHWRVTGDGSTASIYIDDILVSSGPFTPMATNATGVRIGINQAGGQGWWGDMDELRFSTTKRPSGFGTPPTAAFSTATPTTVTLSHTVPATGGALFFWGFVDTTGATYSRLKWFCSDLPSGEEDNWGYDDMVFCTIADVTS